MCSVAKKKKQYLKKESGLLEPEFKEE